ncbi:MAG: DNA polymerase III subunit beta [Candidatus Pacebacteria bacterium]|nr:DNA polymerase III subunit beta [Candidatus Paceibacterota bacterium]
MKIVVLKNNLREGLNIVGKAISENLNLPILKNVLIKTHNNKIKLVATNLELAITQMVSGKIIENGSITVPFSVLSGIVNNSDSERIDLELKNNTLLFKTDNYEASIQGIAEEEFPIIPKIENTRNYLKINGGIFKEAMLKVLNSAQISEIRPEISGVLFDFQISHFKLVTTDSFRLAEKTVFEKEFKTNFQRGFKIIIPLKMVSEAIKILKDDGDLNIFIDPNQILFQNDDIEIISRLIDGNYPDYEQIIPKSFETECILNREHFSSAIKLVSNFTGKTNDIRIKTKQGQKTLEVFSTSPYFGENKYLIPAKIKGENFDVAFNWRYLVDGLKNFNTPDDLIFGVNGEQKPSILKHPQDSSYFYILMPIKGV